MRKQQDIKQRIMTSVFGVGTLLVSALALISGMYALTFCVRLFFGLINGAAA